jgi:hypothetical protein
VPSLADAETRSTTIFTRSHLHLRLPPIEHPTPLRESQPEQSYSERQFYEAALDGPSREIAVVQRVTETEAVKEIEGQFAKNPRRGGEDGGSCFDRLGLAPFFGDNSYPPETALLNERNEVPQ